LSTDGTRPVRAHGMCRRERSLATDLSPVGHDADRLEGRRNTAWPRTNAHQESRLHRSGPGHTREVFLIGLLAMMLPSPALRVSAHAPHDEAERHAPESLGTRDDPDAQSEMEFLALRDPVADAIPRGIHHEEMLFALGIPDRRALDLQSSPGATAA